MQRFLVQIGALALLYLLWTSAALAHGEILPREFVLTEGDIIRAASVNDPDVYIVNPLGYKRLVLNPTIFSFYGHFRWLAIKSIQVGVRDAFPTSTLVRNCENNDSKVYAVEVTEEDKALLHWVNLPAEDAVAQDDDFFKKVFCINAKEFAWYAQSTSYGSIASIPSYERSKLPPPGVNDTSIPLNVPSGFKISVFASSLGPVRFMAVSPDGLLFASMPASVGLYGVGAKTDGKIFVLPDSNNDGKADEARAVLTGLTLPHGLAFFNNYLYVAQETTVVRYPYIGNGVLGARETIISGLPGGSGHASRTIGFSPAGKMYVSLGSSCNACEETNSYRAAILEYNPDGTGGRVFANGLRNSVGFVFNPSSGEIWATDNGRDHLDDDLPPDEINIVRDGGNYGWPYCYGKNIHDTDFDKNIYIAIYPPLPCSDKEPSLFNLEAHSAALGLRFITSPQFPASYQGNVLVAYHCSIDRTAPVGYKVALLRVDGSSILGEEDFISGWLRTDGSKLGRPVDLIFGNDNALYISDDKANVIYRVSNINL